MKQDRTAYRYPTSPANFDEKMIQPSAEFRNEVVGVLRMIFVFAGTYFLLVAAAIGLAISLAWAGVWLMDFLRGWLMILVGIGLIGTGLMVLFFLFKFIFKSHRVDKSAMTEITEKEQPVLFDFLRRLAAETKTPFPKRIFLSADVNASVFYNSSFWSMFVPVRKNLNIGLGLVNCVNVSEFKAVIAHEFGHFSQKSMKLGSYVYNVNRIIHDMLFDNEEYGRTLQAWANLHYIFNLFADITSGIVGGIISVLQALYGKINARYMALSRQMEFHADSVAASVSGSSPLVRALYRLELADNAYNTVIGYYSDWVKENRKGVNVYEHQSQLLKSFAATHRLPVENGFVEVSEDVFSKYRKNRVVVKDQWASHPANADREKHLRSLNLDTELVHDSAWTLFTDPEKLQRQLTDQLYQTVSFPSVPEMVDGEKFQSFYQERLEKYSFGKAYAGFYDNRNISAFDLENAVAEKTTAESLSDILNERALNLQHQINGLETDIRLLEEIGSKDSKINTFDFEGTKYNREDTKGLLVKLRSELKDATLALENTDKEIFRLFYKKSGLVGKEKDAVALYKEMFSDGTATEALLGQVNAMLREASQLYGPHVTQGMAFAVTNNMKREGHRIKADIRETISNPKFSSYYSEEEKKTLEYFTKDRREFISNEGFDSEAIGAYMNALQIYSQVLAQYNFDLKKKTLDRQLKVLEGQTVS
ncbi:MAG TPA: M48 family metalloprotease [Chryseosolibacter sp.]|nr:M48 family metalloprotease [Chryseosolibacter sp.]